MVKTCPFTGVTCMKADCMAWVKIEDVDPDGLPLGTFKKSYCGLLNQQ